MHAQPFIWETHGIHVGTGTDHVKHGIDDLDAVVGPGHPAWVSRPSPSSSTPPGSPGSATRGTRHGGEVHPRGRLLFRLRRPDAGPARKVRRPDPGPLRRGARVAGDRPAACSGTGQSCSRPTGWTLSCPPIHFAPNGIPYDGSAEDTRRLIEERGGVEPFWAAYFDELHRDGGRELADDLRCRAPRPAQALCPAAGVPHRPGRGRQRDGAQAFHPAGDDRRAQPCAGCEPLRPPQGSGHLSAPRDPPPGPHPGHPCGDRRGHPQPSTTSDGTTRRASRRCGKRATATTSRSPGAFPRSARCRQGARVPITSSTSAWKCSTIDLRERSGWRFRTSHSGAGSGPCRRSFPNLPRSGPSTPSACARRKGR